MYLRDIFSFIVLSGLITVSAAADAKFSINTSTIRVIDAGTISANQKVFKLQGIIAPSAKQKCKIRALPWLCGAAARSFLVDIFEENNVKCQNTRESYVKCFLNKVDISLLLVKAGWAISHSTKTDFVRAEKEARENNLGIWSKK
tara:strand:+ start:2546 stop:2980 length:435 start_codon:yes stop_codon:yes gene_type:complete